MAGRDARAFARIVEGIGDALRRRIELDCEAFASNEEARLERRAAVLDHEAGFAAFRALYFPHYHSAPDNLLHKDLEVRLPAIARDPEGRFEVVIAQRGAAKSVVVTLEFVLWVILADLKRCILICSDSSTQADLMLDAVKAEVETNPRLAYDFPELTRGRVWRADEITLAKARVFSLGRGDKVRGRRHGPHRPDLALLDDIENDEHVESPRQRDKTERWVDRGVRKAGDAKGSLDTVMVGTVLHPNAVLARKAREPGVRVTRFDAILRHPDRMDLWEEFAELVRASEDEDGFPGAMAFYEARRPEMNAGARVLWPEVQPLVELMTEWAIDPDTFASERQNKPITPDAIFKRFHYWQGPRPARVARFGAIDPSLGKSGKADPSAILIGELDLETGVFDVTVASIRRRSPDQIISDAIAFHRSNPCALWFVEATQFQEFLRTELGRRAAQAGVSIPTLPIMQTSDKHLRIERVQPPVNDGLIRLRPDMRVLIEQMEHFPHGDHDDGPDCLEMLHTHALHHGMQSLRSGLKVRGVRASRAAMEGYGGASTRPTGGALSTMKGYR